MDAIKLFHGEISKDLLLKQDQFQKLRDKLLRGAADFYGRLEGLLKERTDRESQAALGRAYEELGELTLSIGDAARCPGRLPQGDRRPTRPRGRAGGDRRDQA